MKRLWALVIAVALGFGVVATERLVATAGIGAAFAAKTLCSSIFISGRDLAQIQTQELSSAEIPEMGWIHSVVDENRREVRSSVFGVVRRTAVFRPGRGCTLAIGTTPEQLRHVAPLPVIAAPLSERSPVRLPVGALEAVIAAAFSEPDGTTLRRTRAVVVMQDGRIVAERYATGFTADTPQLGWSMTKSVTATLTGILVGQQRLKLDEPAPVPEWPAGDPRSRITLRQLLQMESGLVFDEDYVDPLDDVIFMLFGTGDGAHFAAGKPLRAPPGTLWDYSSGTSNIVARMVQSHAPERDGAAFARRVLFSPLGMSSAMLESDAAGNPVGSSFMYATPRDWARFGELYRNDGVWQGYRLLPEGWVRFATTPAPHSNGLYGAHFWRRVPSPFDHPDGRLPLPVDAFHAIGHEGQFVSIIPSRRAVVVRLGLSRPDGSWNHEAFLAAVLSALPP